MRMRITTTIELYIDVADYDYKDEMVIAGLLAQEFLDDPGGWIAGLDTECGDYLRIDVGVVE
jgi:hypothetical protein